MVEDTLEQALAMPYSVFQNGPYSPPCDTERVAYSNSLGLLGSEPDPQVVLVACFLAANANCTRSCAPHLPGGDRLARQHDPQHLAKSCKSCSP